jgi:alcohol dehydrogenase class IV
MEPRAPEAIQRLGEALGGRAPERVAGLAAQAGVTRLGELGVTEADLPQIMEGVAQRHDIAANTPGAPSESELRGVLETAL